MTLVEGQACFEYERRHEQEQDQRRVEVDSGQPGHKADGNARRGEEDGGRNRPTPDPLHSSSVIPSRAALTSIPVDSVSRAASSQGWARHIVIPKWVRMASRGRASRMIVS